MKPRHLTTLAVVLVCGAAAAAQTDTYQPAQTPGDQPGRTNQNTQTNQNRDSDHWQSGRRNPQMSATATLAPSDWLVGAKVVSANANETIGTVSDLAVNTGEDKAEFAIISRGGVLGVGGTSVAVPIQALTWSPTQRQFTIAMTADQFKSAPEFKTDTWNTLSDPQWRQTTFGFFHVNDPLRGAAANMDQDRFNNNPADTSRPNRGQFSRAFATGQPTTIRGTVQSIQQQPIGNTQGYVCTVTDQNGRQQQVHLGPAWFLDHQAGLPQQGDQVEIRGMQTDLYGQQVTVAESITGPQTTLRLRDNSGQPVWNASVGGGRGLARGNTNQFNQPGRRTGQRDQNGRILGAPEMAENASVYLKASDIKGKDLLAQDGTKAGDLHTIVLDTRTGKIAFVTVAFGGFLGIGEKDVAVPWDLLNVSSDGRIHLTNIDKDQLRNAPQVDTNWETSLRDPSLTQQIYQHYGLDASWLTQSPDTMNSRFNQNRYDQNRSDQNRYDQTQDRNTKVPGNNTEVGPGGERHWRNDPNNPR